MSTLKPGALGGSQKPAPQPAGIVVALAQKMASPPPQSL